jgi:penicillin-binding protein 1A
MRKLARTIALGGVALSLALALIVPGTLALARGGEAESGSVAKRLGVLAQRSTVYASDGTEMAQLGKTDRAVVTSLREVPKFLIDAVIATEDRTFWTNRGIDLQAAARALVANVSSGDVKQGGSTITQQLVKNRILSPRRNIERKIEETALALQLNDELSKKQILLDYLNTVYFGENAYGVRVAAERIIGKRLEDINLADAALLAGLISSPNDYNPYDNPKTALQRRSNILDRMVDESYVTAAQAAAAQRQPLRAADQRPRADLRPRDYFVDEVQRRLLADPRLGDTPQVRTRQLLEGGLRIQTTYDPRLETFAQLAVTSILPPGEFTASLAAIDPKTGAVRALVGGPNFEQSQYNLATQGTRQPGSAFKMITLATAIENGYSPEDRINGSSGCHIKMPNAPDWTPGGHGGGTMTLRTAAEESINCAFARLIVGLGPDKVAAMARKMGITTDVPALPSITLGTVEASPLDMAAVAATLANDGVARAPYLISKVETADGRVLFENKPKGTKAVGPNTARTVVDVLKGVIESSHGTANAARLDRPAFGKTGTTDDSADAWFVGGVPQLVTSVWMGSPVARVPMTNVGGIQVFGGTYPARIWQRFMSSALAGTPVEDFTAPNEFFWPKPTMVGEFGRKKDGENLKPLSSSSGNGEQQPAVPYPSAAPTPTSPPKGKRSSPTTTRPKPAPKPPPPPPTTSPPTTAPPTTAPPTTVASPP